MFIPTYPLPSSTITGVPFCRWIPFEPPSTTSGARSLSPVDITTTFEVEFSAGVWTDKSADVTGQPRWSWGIRGNGPTDLVAGPGRFQFELLNHDSNSESTEGLYSPDHANVKSGWGVNTAIRVKLVYGGVTKYKKYYVTSIRPAAGAAESRRVSCLALDWMDEASRTVPQLSIATDQRGDQLFTTVTNSITNAPDNSTSTAGSDSYPFAFDQVVSQRTTALAMYQRIAQSGLDRIFLTMDATDGETLTYSPRGDRLLDKSFDETFDDDSSVFRVVRSRDRIINVVDVAFVKREVGDNDTTVVASLDDETPVVPAGETITIILEYRDPDQVAASVAATDIQSATENTDYEANTAADGSGTDISTDLTVTITDQGTSASIDVENTGGTSGFITLLQVRGRILKAFDAQHVQSDDATSKSTYGARLQSITMPWLSDRNTAKGAADYLLDQRKDPVSDAPLFSYWANRHDELADAALALDVNSRIGIDETVTGITSSASRGFWINSVTMELVGGGSLRVSYGLEDSPDLSSFFTLGTSTLGGSDILGYF